MVFCNFNVCKHCNCKYYVEETKSITSFQIRANVEPISFTGATHHQHYMHRDKALKFTFNDDSILNISVLDISNINPCFAGRPLKYCYCMVTGVPQHELSHNCIHKLEQKVLNQE